MINLAIKYKIKRFIFTSSMATYGYGNNEKVFTEETLQKPIDPYGIAKLACEMDIKVACEHHNLEYCIIRPHNVYGKYQNIWDKYRNVLGIWTYYILNNKSITIYGDGKQKRAFTYVDDILEPLWNSAILEKSKNKCINLGGIKAYSINDAADIFLKITNYDTNKKQYLEKRHEVKHAVCSYKKSVDLLNFEHKTNLEEGLKIMWEWSKKQPNRERKKWKKYELDVNLYNFWK